MIELHDFIQFAFRCSYPNITTEFEILHIDSSELGSSFVNFFFFNFCHSTFYLIEIEL